MRKWITFLFVGVIFFITDVFQAFSWGFFAHQRINQMAVFTLPPGMIGFYKKHVEYLTSHAVDPDKRRRFVEEEPPRHYIDADHYGNHPFDSIPIYWKDAVEKYSEDSLKAYGIVPWYIEKMLYRLTEAFKEENQDEILYLSANIGHYIADAHVPLHTTENYNGQLTNQKGIHGFWESRIPELKADGYDYFVGRAKYIEKPIEKAWSAVKMSYSEKDSVLLFEAALNKKFSADKKYSYENKGKRSVKVYSKEYTEEYDRMLNGMVERRMREAIITVGSFWYTAWVNAGQPDLDKIGNKAVADSLNSFQKGEEPLQLKNKNMKGHEEE